MSDRGSSRILAKGLEILELIAKAPDGLSVGQLVESIGLHRSSIYRYLDVLLRAGYVSKKDGRYVLGAKTLELASSFLERLDVRRAAHPLLIELAERLQVTVHLGQLAGAEVLYIDKIETHRSLPLYSRIGRKVPAHCTALGKALLAFSPPARREIILKELELKAYTPHTITDLNRLRKELEATRKRGYAVDREEHEEGIACVAAPIFDFYNEPFAAVSVTDLSRRILGNEKFYARAVCEVAKRISSVLGKRGGDREERGPRPSNPSAS